MLLQMKSSELGELYALLHMYQNVYGGVEGKLLAEIVDNYNLNSALNYNEEGTGTFILNALKIAL